MDSHHSSLSSFFLSGTGLLYGAPPVGVLGLDGLLLHSAALTLGKASPDTESLVLLHRIFQALDAYVA
ncbi:unannotated protein [freshwater metagenome]|uniref:Unannotated protein n=1 Tax=freshwater metagenome TaxID=449393 RepID=A0A6J7IYK2_9ZZZZ